MNTMRNFVSSMKMSAKKMQYGLLTALLLFILVSVGEAVWLDVPATGMKCVSEEIQSNVVVLADYIIISEDDSLLPTISVKVTSPYGKNLHHMENVTVGEFAFTTQESGNYMACFTADAKSHGNKNVSISVDWKTGIAAKDWKNIAKKEKIEGVELEIRKLEAAVESIHENLVYIRNKEADMRTVSEKTNSRVAWYSTMSMGICIAVSGVQVVYLKQYFQKKKLI
ncbi:transmembrane emp24 domain-containing protein p24delta3-like [Raphanus sativus]|uniref:Transmembrane emp24 domain-containing protein p24delta3-like n=1 Tax=Raphanus sativus TaxID=3726 RepID=A0A6J0NLH0_RAPSA|nr:transmembrane emp24 domain-containing protein p24delta3-like [Raphanus sativus]